MQYLFILNISYLCLLFLSLAKRFFENGKFLTGIFTIIVFFGLPLSPILLFAIYRWYRQKSMNIKLIQVPTYKIEKTKFFEIGTLIDGNISIEDLIAFRVYQIINNAPANSEIEKHIQKIMPTKKSILYYYNLSKGRSFDKRAEAEKALRKVTKPIYDEMIQHKLMIYNPMIMRWIASLSGTIIFIIGFLTYQDLGIELLLICTLISLFFHYLSIFSFNFHLNFRRVLDIRQELLGFQMYLKTTHIYDIEKNPQIFKKYAPYFIALKIKEKEILESVLSMLE